MLKGMLWCHFVTIEIIKKFLTENDYQVGDKLPSTRKLAAFIGISGATARMALINLLSQGILDKKENGFILADANFTIETVHAKTLVEKVAHKLKKHIEKNFGKEYAHTIGTAYGYIVNRYKLIQKLLNNYHSQTIFGIIGFSLGSIIILSPIYSLNLESIISVILLILGFVIGKNIK